MTDEHDKCFMDLKKLKFQINFHSKIKLFKFTKLILTQKDISITTSSKLSP